jgi:hypothetical protein
MELEILYLLLGEGLQDRIPIYLFIDHACSFKKILN